MNHSMFCFSVNRPQDAADVQEIWEFVEKVQIPHRYRIS